MTGKVTFNPTIHLFGGSNVRQTQFAFTGGVAPVADANFIKNVYSANYSTEHPRVNNSDGVEGESANGKVFPFLLA